MPRSPDSGLSVLKQSLKLSLGVYRHIVLQSVLANAWVDRAFTLYKTSFGLGLNRFGKETLPEVDNESAFQTWEDLGLDKDGTSARRVKESSI